MPETCKVVPLINVKFVCAIAAFVEVPDAVKILKSEGFEIVLNPVPELPDEPLEPDEPDEPEVPLVPDEPDVPLEPESPVVVTHQ